MDAMRFVELMDEHAGRSAIESVLSQLEAPAGRKPTESVVRLSKWFNSLDEVGRSAVRDIIAQSAATALFGVYCVLDGSRTILDDFENERLDLVYRSKDGDFLIASATGDAPESLHEIRGDLI